MLFEPNVRRAFSTNRFQINRCASFTCNYSINKQRILNLLPDSISSLKIEQGILQEDITMCI